MSDIQKTHHPEFPVSEIRHRVGKTRNRTEVTWKVLVASIQEFGIVEPLLLDGDHRVIHGQYRLEAAKALALTTVPAIVVSGMSESEARAYHLMAGRIVEWNDWNPAATDKILTELDGGLGTESVLGFEAPSERGEWRDLLREVGWFIEVIPEALSSSKVTVEELASLLEQQLNAEHGKYQFDNSQLLYMEVMRRQLAEVRDEMVREGAMSREDADASTTTFDPTRELRYVAERSKRRADAKLAKPSDLPKHVDPYAIALQVFVTGDFYE